MQRYRGEPVLTWSEGQGLGGVQTTETVDYVEARMTARITSSPRSAPAMA